MRSVPSGQVPANSAPQVSMLPASSFHSLLIRHSTLRLLTLWLLRRSSIIAGSLQLGAAQGVVRMVLPKFGINENLQLVKFPPFIGVNRMQQELLRAASQQVQ